MNKYRLNIAIACFIASGILGGVLIMSIIIKSKGEGGDATNSELLETYYTLSENSDGSVTSTPAVTDEVFTNPGMGWILIDTALPDYIDAGRSGDYPLVSNVSIMSTWAELEPEEGQFDWSLVDKSIEAWTAKGKEIKFRISADDFPYYDVVARGVPDWVIDLGVPIKSDYYQEHYLRYPDANNAIYQEKLANFVKAYADKYGDNPNVKLVDLRGYGLWGEWHSGYVYDSLELRITALKSIIDIWYNAWSGKKPLVFSYSHEWRSLAAGTVKPSAYEDYLKYSAFDYALTKEDIHWEREGFYGAMEPNEWKLNEETFQSGSIEIAEIAGGYSDLAVQQLSDGIDHHANALDECLRAHPNYITLFGWDDQGDADEFYANRTDLIEKGLKNMGYRFVIDKVIYEPAVQKTELNIDISLKNLAVGRCHEEAWLKLALVDRDGKEAASGISDIDLSAVTLEKPAGGKIKIDTSLCESGEYLLKASIIDKSGKGIIRMPLKGRDDKESYIVGTVNIQ